MARHPIRDKKPERFVLAETLCNTLFITTTPRVLDFIDYIQCQLNFL